MSSKAHVFNLTRRPIDTLWVNQVDVGPIPGWDFESAQPLTSLKLPVAARREDRSATFSLDRPTDLVWEVDHVGYRASIAIPRNVRAEDGVILYMTARDLLLMSLTSGLLATFSSNRTD